MFGAASLACFGPKGDGRAYMTQVVLRALATFGLEVRFALSSLRISRSSASSSASFASLSPFRYGAHATFGVPRQRSGKGRMLRGAPDRAGMASNSAAKESVLQLRASASVPEYRSAPSHAS